MNGSPGSAVQVETGTARLDGFMAVPDLATGLVVFAHGSGSSRHSPRNAFVATRLNESGFGTLLFDLLTAEEAADRENVFDIELLASRLEGAVRWMASRPATAGMPIGLFGASTGAAAALVAASRMSTIGAVVSRGGRPDLAGSALGSVKTPTLLIVGGDDVTVLGLNREAASRLVRSTCELEVVPGASHLFEEPGTLESAAALAAAWFERWLDGMIA